MEKKFTHLLVLIFLSSCSSMAPKPHVTYNNSTLKPEINKIIVFRTAHFNGKVTRESLNLNPAILAGWKSVYGNKSVIPAYSAVQEINEKIGTKSYLSLIHSLENSKTNQKAFFDSKMNEFVLEMTKKFGHNHFALAVLSGGVREYNAGKPIYLNIGLFDAQSLTWKIITKVKVQKRGEIGNWNAASEMIVANSFDAIKKMELKYPEHKKSKIKKK